MILIGSTLSAFIVGLLLLYQFGSRQANLALADKANDRQAFLEEFIELYGKQIENFAYDYSFWDEMVEFVSSGDTAWALENVDVGVTTYQADAAWVFKPDGRLVYGMSVTARPSLVGDLKVVDECRKAFATDSFSHFFAHTDNGLIEVRTAPIQPSSDANRTTTPSGHFAVARVMDSVLLGKYERALDAHVTLRYPDGSSGDELSCDSASSNGHIEYEHKFTDRQGDPIARLVCHADAPILGLLKKSEITRLTYAGIFSAVLLAVLFVSLRRWVGAPLALVMHSLESGDPIPKERLSGTGSEFVRIGLLVSEFLEQQQTLEHEVSERVRAEKEVQRRESLLRATLESTADGVLVVGQDGTAIDFNSRFRELWRIPDEVISEKSDEKMLRFVLSQLKDPDAFIAKVQALYNSNEESFDTLHFIDGREFERYSCALNMDGAVIGRVWSFRDTTQRSNAEREKLKLTEALDRAQRMEALGILAGGVAHDLNNTLGPVVGYSEMILRELPEDSKSAVRMKKIAASAGDAVAIIQDLLTLARRGRYEMHPIQVNDVITAYLDSVGYEKLQALHGNVTVRTELLPDCPHIMGSEPHLGKVIMNLVSNALEAMPQGGTLLIRTQKVHLDSLPSGYKDITPGNYFVVRIKDTGVGIAKEDISKVFEPYFSRKQMGRSGSGLGLSVVYGIVKDHHGYYDIESVVGEGTEFILYFPTTERAPIPVPTRTASSSAGTESVLIVDDCAEQRDLCKDIVSSLGYHATTVENGHRAVEFLTANEADVVLLDMIMEPNFDGLDTYRAIRAIRPDQKVIVVSGFSATERVEEMQRLGAGEYVRKPYGIDKLATALRKELEREPTPA